MTFIDLHQSPTARTGLWHSVHWTVDVKQNKKKFANYKRYV